MYQHAMKAPDEMRELHKQFYAYMNRRKKCGCKTKKGTVIGEKSMKNEEYKKLSIKEFTKAAGRYESSHAGIYEMCKKDYPDILEELEKEPFRTKSGNPRQFNYRACK